MTPPAGARTRSLHLRPLATALSLALATGAAPHASPAVHLGGPAPAATQSINRVVTNCDDAGTGSLREAYTLAQDRDTVDLSQLTCSRITLSTGAMANGARRVTVKGPAQREVTIDGAIKDRIFIHNYTGIYARGSLTIRNLTITSGYYKGRDGGGCIFEGGDLSIYTTDVTSCTLLGTGSNKARGGAIEALNNVILQDSTVTYSVAYSAAGGSAGGGIFAGYNASLNRSTVSGNKALNSQSNKYASGGGVFAGNVFLIAYSTISGNSAKYGGGLSTPYHRAGLFDNSALFTSTVSGNYAINSGGGIHSAFPVIVTSSTIAKNTDANLNPAATGAGLLLVGTTALLSSSIIAHNTSGNTEADVGSFDGASQIHGANNLIMASSLPVPDGTIVGVDPLLGPLQNNGGLTLTHALLPGSPAIDKGSNPSHFLFDQRGVKRVEGPSPDIGAVESEDIFTGDFDPG